MKSALAVSALGVIVFSALACGAPGAASEATTESTAVTSSDLAAPVSKDSIDFDLYVNPKFFNCLAAYPGDPYRYPQAHVHVSRGELNDELTLVGKNIKDAIKDASARLRNVARPMSLNAYKVDVAVGLIERVVMSTLA